MALKKTLDRLKRIDELILRRATGTPDDFSDKLGISKRRLYEILNDLKDYGLGISYCSVRRSYIYNDDTTLFHGQVSSTDALRKTDLSSTYSDFRLNKDGRLNQRGEHISPSIISYSRSNSKG